MSWDSCSPSFLQAINVTCRCIGWDAVLHLKEQDDANQTNKTSTCHVVHVELAPEVSNAAKSLWLSRIGNQVTGSGFIRWLQPSWQTARWAGRANGHWFFNKASEAVSQPGYGDILSHGDGLFLMMPRQAPDHRPPHKLHAPLWSCPITSHWR